MTDQQPSVWRPPTDPSVQPLAGQPATVPTAPVVPVVQTGNGNSWQAGGRTGPQTDRRDPGTAIVVLAWIATVLTLFYMLPWAVAASRGRSNQAAIGLINLLLGWTLVGWIVALVMACQAHQVVGGYPTVVVAQQFTTTPPPGWYPAPDGIGVQYWDGATWTSYRG